MKGNNYNNFNKLQLQTWNKINNIKKEEIKGILINSSTPFFQAIKTISIKQTFLTLMYTHLCFTVVKINFNSIKVLPDVTNFYKRKIFEVKSFQKKISIPKENFVKCNTMF